MNKFIASVHLQDADEKDYNVISKELQRVPFKKGNLKSAAKQIKAAQKEFILETNAGLQEVSAALRKAAEKTGKLYSFTIMKNKLIYN